MATKHGQKIQIKPPLGKDSEIERQREEILKYLRLIPTEPEPNLGRVYEIKQEIKKGTYLTREMIEEAARQLANRLSNTE